MSDCIICGGLHEVEDCPRQSVASPPVAPLLPLPLVRSVQAVISYHDSFVLIVSDQPTRVEDRRFSVIHIVSATGKATCIGRELDFEVARVIAQRPQQ